MSSRVYARDMMLGSILFLYGLVAGFLLARLRRSAPAGRDRRLAARLGRVVMAASLTLAAALLTALAWQALAG